MLVVNETGVTNGHVVGESGPYEPFTENRGALFRAYQNWYGRCTGKVYIDTKNQEAKPIGWVFQKRIPYRDSSRTCLHETWVTLSDD